MTDLLMPKLGLTMTEGTIIEWLKKPGDKVDKGDILFIFETEKSTLEFEAPVSGFLTEIRVSSGATVPCYTVLGAVGETLSQTVPIPVASLPAGRSFRASPRAKRAARQMGIDLRTVAGTGPHNRIVEADVLALSGEATQPAATPLAKRLAAAENIDLGAMTGSGRNGKITRADVEKRSISPEPDPSLHPLSAIRAITARHMTESAQTAPQVTLTTEADAVELVRARDQINTLLRDQKISYNALLIAQCARALTEFPDLNAHFEQGGLRRHAEVNIGLAVDTERGLLVPVVPNAAKLSLAEIQRTLTERIERAQAGHSQPTDLKGGTFTITNLGMFEIDTFTPLVNLPQVAILGVGRIVQRAVPYNGQVAIREQMALSLSFDHRAVDGGPAARFLKHVKVRIENPYGLLLSGQ